MLKINSIKLTENQELMELDLIYEKDTKFQEIKLYNNKDKKLVLTLDKFIQFIEGEDEQIYHDMLTRPAFEMNTKAKKILVLGGGDGLCSRNLFKLQPEAQITLVDIDDEVIALCRTNERIKIMNEGSLEKCNIVIEDALKWVFDCTEKYEIIILDFPDPNSEELEKLYKRGFIYNIIQLLDKKGVISIQTNEKITDKVYEIVSGFTKKSKAIEYTMPFLSGGTIVIGQC